MLCVWIYWKKMSATYNIQAGNSPLSISMHKKNLIDQIGEQISEHNEALVIVHWGRNLISRIQLSKDFMSIMWTFA